eukprot:473131_1
MKKSNCNIRTLFVCLLALFALINSQTCNPQKLPSGKISVLSTNNAIFGPVTQWHVFVPSRYDNTYPVPLLLLFHGLGDECGRFMDVTGFIPFAEIENFILISVCGTSGNLGVGFNAGTCCGFPENSPTNDIAFASWIVSNISSELCIDSTQVFIAGFSNGAMMVEVVSCNASHIFRAGASVSGITELRPGNEDGLAVCDEQYASSINNDHYTSILHIHGTIDATVPFPGNPVLGFPPVQENMNRWYDRNMCEGNYTVTINNERYRNQLWDHCVGNTEIELVIHERGGHTWPRDEYFHTTNYIMEFLHRNGMEPNDKYVI